MSKAHIAIMYLDKKNKESDTLHNLDQKYGKA
jgi:hypothetical protein